jgi:hypothetical protein
VKSVIIHKDGRRIDLDASIGPELYETLEASQGCGSQRSPLWFCGHCNGGVYIRHGTVYHERLYGVHYLSGNCVQRFEIRKNRMSDEHKRMQEYTVRSANAGGFDADTEVRTTGRTTVDVVVDGRIGIEVQLSGLTAGAAVARTARSMNAGLETVAWVAEKTTASWTGKVPGYQWLDNGQLHAAMPPPRSVRSRGVITFRRERSWRGGEAPLIEPLTVLVDDAVVRMAQGSIRAVHYRGNVELVREDGIALYEELTGMRLAPFTGRPPSRTLRKGPAVECLRPQATTTSVSAVELVPRCQNSICDDPDSARPYENGAVWLCPGHARHRYALPPQASPHVE